MSRFSCLALVDIRFAGGGDKLSEARPNAAPFLKAVELAGGSNLQPSAESSVAHLSSPARAAQNRQEGTQQQGGGRLRYWEHISQRGTVAKLINHSIGFQS
jgi:hypothetical protein